MRFSKYVPLLVLLFSFTVGFSQTFTVTNKEDDDISTNTLRYALTHIPANTPGYTINFNLPGPVSDLNRTIRLKKALPPIPSNVTIDGSTQNFPTLGVSGAKIIIEPEYANSTFSGLYIGPNYNTYAQTVNVAIYGLYIRNFARITSLQNVSGNQAGIQIDYRASDIKIGAVGKGNVICGNVYGILINNNSYYSNITDLANITIQSNLIGVMHDGVTANSNVTGISANLYDTSLSIGGDNSGDGNVISANQINVNVTKFYTSTNARFPINIVNNKIGTNYAGTADFSEHPLFLSSSSLGIYGIKVDASLANLYIRKNVISGNRTWGASIANADFVMTGNRIGTGVGTETLGNGGGIRIETGATGTIGGTVATSTDEGNIIANNDYGVESVSAKPVKITRNSFYCNKIFGIGQSLNNNQAYAQILVQKANHLEGRANPNAEVELFYTINCNGICEGRDYIETVQTGSDGRWKYDGPLTGKVTVTASLLNYTTSQFSTAALLDLKYIPNEYILTPVTCNGNGSIKIPEPREGFTFQWNKIEDDGTKVPKGNTQEITGLIVGTYEVIINDGCKEMTKQFEIKDQTLSDPIIQPVVNNCGQKQFVLQASVDRSFGSANFQWLNTTTQAVVATGASVTLPAGKYSLRVTDNANCPKTVSLAEIKLKLKPIIQTTTLQVKDAQCGKFDGYIKGITIGDGTGTITYTWSRYDPTAIPKIGTQIQSGPNPDLLNIEGGGYYILEVTDQGTCSPADPYIRFIQATKSVYINNGTPINTTCTNNNGAINGLSITEGDTWKLTSSTGTFTKSGTTSPAPTVFNITGLPAGTYYLDASSSTTLCAAERRTFFISPTAITEYTVQAPIIQKANCDLNNGSIKLTYTGIKRPAEGKYQWKNAAGDDFSGTSTELKNLDKGVYTLYIIDENGCDSPPLGPYEVGRIEKLLVDKTSGTWTDDPCALGRGTITGVKIYDGLPISGTANNVDAVYSYAWKDKNGITIRTTKDLINVGPGEYYLEVSDQTSCPDVSQTFTIAAPIIPLATPTVNNMNICYATEIMVPILAPEEGIYQLFKDKDDTLPLTQSEKDKGILIFKVGKTGDYYIKRKLGTCESDFTTFHVEVTIDNLEIMNTITPNGDGMNDNWVINGLPAQGNTSIKLYTRSGQLVYESLGQYTKPFDGRFRGKDLPAGVYYYKIDLRSDCAPLGGSLTLLR